MHPGGAALEMRAAVVLVLVLVLMQVVTALLVQHMPDNCETNIIRCPSEKPGTTPSHRHRTSLRTRSSERAMTSAWRRRGGACPGVAWTHKHPHAARLSATTRDDANDEGMSFFHFCFRFIDFFQAQTRENL